ncbi:hypothetical protein SESBI_24042 [Sesbania bispinosa]|nr:hypothetical protein SESBI_24042 [Sesbania bispinosa]
MAKGNAAEVAGGSVRAAEERGWTTVARRRLHGRRGGGDRKSRRRDEKGSTEVHGPPGRRWLWSLVKEVVRWRRGRVQWHEREQAACNDSGTGMNDGDSVLPAYKGRDTVAPPRREGRPRRPPLLLRIYVVVVGGGRRLPGREKGKDSGG